VVAAARQIAVGFRDRPVQQMQSEFRHHQHLSVASFRKATQIIRLGVQFIRDNAKPPGDFGRIIGDASHFDRGHAQKWDRELLRAR